MLQIQMYFGSSNCTFLYNLSHKMHISRWKNLNFFPSFQNPYLLQFIVFLIIIWKRIRIKTLFGFFPRYYLLSQIITRLWMGPGAKWLFSLNQLGHQLISINFYHWSRISTLFLSNPAISKRSGPFFISGLNEHHQFIFFLIFAFNSYFIDPHRLISLSQTFKNINETWPIKIGPQGPIRPNLGPKFDGN